VTYTAGRLVAYLQIDKSITTYGKHKAVNIIYEKNCRKKNCFASSEGHERKEIAKISRAVEKLTKLALSNTA